MTTVFIISAPSGSGKSTLVSRLLANVPGLMFSVSYTTADARVKLMGKTITSCPGKHSRCAERGEFLEWLRYLQLLWNALWILEKARVCQMDLVLDIDVQGARQLKEKIPEAANTLRLILAPCGSP
jgi:guanylate kinase